MKILCRSKEEGGDEKGPKREVWKSKRNVRNKVCESQVTIILMISIVLRMKILKIPLAVNLLIDDPLAKDHHCVVTVSVS